MTAARKLKTTASATPQTQAELEETLARIAELRNGLKSASDVLDAHITELRERAQRTATPVEAEVERLVGVVQSYCEAHRRELTDDGRTKTVKLKNGVVSWRKGRVRVVIDNEDNVLTTLKSMRLKRFIRVVEQVDKAEMLRVPVQAQRVPGVTIVEAAETFYVETPI